MWGAVWSDERSGDEDGGQWAGGSLPETARRDASAVATAPPRSAPSVAFDSLRAVREHITEMMQEQVARASEEGTPANQALAGDGRAHLMLMTLLPTNLQRAVFLAVVSREAAYPRVRTLFGAPPYAFLRAEDAGMLRAAGFAASRRNVAYDGFHVANYSQFGAPHLIDAYGRQYRVAQERDDESAPVAFMALRRGGDPRTTFVVRIKKRARAERAALMRDATGRAALSFPRIGELLHMTPTPTILRMMAAPATDAAPVEVRVVALRLSDHKAATAILSGVVQ